jgi:hypothetical protein
VSDEVYTSADEASSQEGVLKTEALVVLEPSQPTQNDAEYLAGVESRDQKLRRSSKLRPQGKVLQKEVRTGMKRPNEQVEQETQQARHECAISNKAEIRPGAAVRTSRPIGVFVIVLPAKSHLILPGSNSG